MRARAPGQAEGGVDSTDRAGAPQVRPDGGADRLMQVVRALPAAVLRLLVADLAALAHPSDPPPGGEDGPARR